MKLQTFYVVMSNNTYIVIRETLRDAALKLKRALGAHHVLENEPNARRLSVSSIRTKYIFGYEEDRWLVINDETQTASLYIIDESSTTTVQFRIDDAYAMFEFILCPEDEKN